MSGLWPGRGVMVTGGGGFLGKAVVKRLEASGTDEILAAVAGGISANRESPGRLTGSL